jgi:hypothetical protein
VEFFFKKKVKCCQTPTNLICRAWYARQQGEVGSVLWTVELDIFVLVQSLLKGTEKFIELLFGMDQWYLRNMYDVTVELSAHLCKI